LKLKHLMALIVVLVIAAIVVDLAPIIGLGGSRAWRPLQSIRRGLDVKGGQRVILQCLPTEDIPRIDDQTMSDVIQILRTRVDALGVSEPVIQRKGADQVVVELPDVDDPEGARELIKKTALLRFVYIRGMRSQRHPTNYRYEYDTATDKQGHEHVVLYDQSQGGKEVDLPDFFDHHRNEYDVIVTGRELIAKDVRANFNPSTAQPYVSIRFNREGAKAFSDFTRGHIGDILAIELDKEIISAPFVKTHIRDGSGEISGGFKDINEAEQLATLLRSGALPVPLKELEITRVDATLGKGAEQKTVYAGIFGALAVIVFMVLFYRLPGVLASIALAFYALFTMMLFKLFSFTLSLPGIAGFIIAIGMAVDANILIFERMREELRSGKTLHSAIDAGFARAWPSIRDSNISTWFTCGVLYGFGTGPIRGFAVTLALGVVVSMFTAITVTRTMLHLVTGMAWTHKAGLYGVTAAYVKAANIRRELIRYKWFYLALSAVIIVPGIVYWVVHGLNKGIDFVGGHQVELRMAHPFKASQIEAAAARAGIEGAKVKTASGYDVTIQYKSTGKETTKEGETSAAERTTPTGHPLADALIANIKRDVGPIAVTRTLKLDFENAVAEDTLRAPLRKLLVGPVIELAPGGKEARIRFTAATNPKLTGPEIESEVKDTISKNVRRVTNSQLVEKEAISFTEIGPVIAREMTRNAFLAIVWASVLIVLYIGIMFRQAELWDGLKYGLCAVMALLHDVAFVTGIFAILGRLLGWQVDGLFVTALLTTIGFSVHDTIVVYDRIRENSKHRERGEPFDRVVNKSLLQTFRRSVFTSMTVLLTLLALIFLGAGSLREFNFALLLGIFTGTYSSIFNASPLVVIWDEVAGRRRRGEARPKPAVAERPLVSEPLVKVSEIAPPPPVARPATPAPGRGDGGEPESVAEAEEKPATDRVRPKARGGGKKPKRKRRF
jgi:preprotein translocase subunit SecD